MCAGRGAPCGGLDRILLQVVDHFFAVAHHAIGRSAVQPDLVARHGARRIRGLDPVHLSRRISRRDGIHPRRRAGSVGGFQRDQRHISGRGGATFRFLAATADADPQYRGSERRGEHECFARRPPRIASLQLRYAAHTGIISLITAIYLRIRLLVTPHADVKPTENGVARDADNEAHTSSSAGPDRRPPGASGRYPVERATGIEPA